MISGLRFFKRDDTLNREGNFVPEAASLLRCVLAIADRTDEQSDGTKRWIGRFLMEHLLATARSSVSLCSNKSAFTHTLIVLVIAIVTGCEHSSPTETNETSSEMIPEFQLPRGIEVADLTGIYESYAVTTAQGGYHVFTVNVSAENIFRVFCRLAAEVKEPAFLLLETGTHRDVEKELRKDNTGPLHKDVYYLDGMKWGDAKSIAESYSELFIHDGGINYGFGSHEGHDEVFVGPYRIFSIYADEPAKYHSALEELGIPQVDRVKTVWENFTQDSPGRRSALMNATPTIWEMIEELKKRGLYLAERREN